MAMQDLDLEFEELHGDVDTDLRQGENYGNPAEGEELPADEDVLAGLQQIKKRVQRTQPKLNEARLTSANGLPALSKLFVDYQPDSKRSQYENLDEVMGKIEHWAHCLFPKLKFDDFIGRLESLGCKRAVKTCMTKIRLDMPLYDEDFVDESQNGNIPENMEQSQSREPAADEDDEEHYWEPTDDLFADDRPNEGTKPESAVTGSPQSVPQSTTVSDNQKARAEANRARALLLRQKRMQYFEPTVAAEPSREENDTNQIEIDDIPMDDQSEEFLNEDELIADLADTD